MPAVYLLPPWGVCSPRFPFLEIHADAAIKSGRSYGLELCTAEQRATGANCGAGTGPGRGTWGLRLRGRARREGSGTADLRTPSEMQSPAHAACEQQPQRGWVLCRMHPAPPRTLHPLHPLHPPPLRPRLQSKRPTSGCRGGGGYGGGTLAGLPRGLAFGGGEAAMSLETRGDADSLGQLKLFPAFP